MQTLIFALLLLLSVLVLIGGCIFARRSEEKATEQWFLNQEKQVANSGEDKES